MKAKINVHLVTHLLLTEQLKLEQQARQEFDRPDGTEDQSDDDKKFNRATFNGRGEAYRNAAFEIGALRQMLED